MSDVDFPVNPFYKPHVMDGTTIARSGKWWSAALLIREPQNETLFIGLYRWVRIPTMPTTDSGKPIVDSRPCRSPWRSGGP